MGWNLFFRAIVWSLGPKATYSEYVGLGGCAALTNPVGDGVPVRHVDPHLLGKPKDGAKTIPLSLLGQPAPAGVATQEDWNYFMHEREWGSVAKAIGYSLNALLFVLDSMKLAQKQKLAQAWGAVNVRADDVCRAFLEHALNYFDTPIEAAESLRPDAHRRTAASSFPRKSSTSAHASDLKPSSVERARRRRSQASATEQSRER